ncbi:MAG: thioredoxin-disulfide reductase [Candidatus Bathyarchaeia archaeon]
MENGPPNLRNVIILGSGPAGLTAALYTARAKLNPLVIAGFQPGGQLMLTSGVENYPGFADGILGPDLMRNMRGQAEKFGAEFVDSDANAVDFKIHPFKIYVGEEVYLGRSVIIATGASAKWLGLESETQLRGKGVSSCATCDGPFFKGREVVVVGGGDAALEEALFLTKFATKVTVIHRRDSLRASKIMQDRAFRNEKTSFIWDSVVEEILGTQTVEGVRIRNVKTNQAAELKCGGVFIAIGHEPNTKFLQGQIELDVKGYIVTKNETFTSVPGVFAAGDVFDYRYRQAVTAAGSGCKAALDAEKFLAEQH